MSFKTTQSLKEFSNVCKPGLFVVNKDTNISFIVLKIISKTDSTIYFLYYNCKHKFFCQGAIWNEIVSNYEFMVSS